MLPSYLQRELFTSQKECFDTIVSFLCLYIINYSTPLKSDQTIICYYTTLLFPGGKELRKAKKSKKIGTNTHVCTRQTNRIITFSAAALGIVARSAYCAPLADIFQRVEKFSFVAFQCGL